MTHHVILLSMRKLTLDTTYIEKYSLILLIVVYLSSFNLSVPRICADVCDSTVSAGQACCEDQGGCADDAFCTTCNHEKKQQSVSRFTAAKNRIVSIVVPGRILPIVSFQNTDNQFVFQVHTPDISPHISSTVLRI